MTATATAPIPIPDDVLAYLRTTFSLANERVTRRIDEMPTLHEEALDFAFIEMLSGASGPHIGASGVVVDLDVHFVGSGWHYDRWEVADLGLIINFRLNGATLRTKIVLLQSKRMYPREVDFVEDRGLVRQGGFGSLMQPSIFSGQPRTFRFDDSCRYKALQVGDDQWRAIEAYEQQYEIPVYYNLYHPSVLPISRDIPVRLSEPAPSQPIVVGSRVLSASALRSKSLTMPRNYAPSYDELQTTGAVGISVQDFICDQVLACREGYIADDPSTDAGVNRIFNQRAAPIAAAIRFDIDFPESMTDVVNIAFG